MKTSLQIAIGIQVVIMALVLVPPLWVSMTGTEVALETIQVDPRALFRGDYVILDYKIGEEVVPEETRTHAEEYGTPIYATVSLERPAKLIAFSSTKPVLEEDQACLTGVLINRWFGAGQRMRFPQISQYFVPEGEGKIIEDMRGEDLLAIVQTTKSCGAGLSGLELATSAYEDTE